MSVRVRGRHRPRGSGGAFWTSYADMMCGLMMVFGLVMVFCIYQFSKVQEDKRVELAEKETQLAAQQTALDKQSDELEAAQALLRLQQSTLDIQQGALDDKQNELNIKDLALLAAQVQVSEKQAELDVNNLALQSAQVLVEEAQINMRAQQRLLDDQQLLMATQQQRIDALVGVRTQIIEDLSRKLHSVNLDVAVDGHTGAITMRSEVLFDSDKSVLNDKGKEELVSFIPEYLRTLLKSEYKEYVAEIIIEGHADSDGSFLYNLKLSQDRALAVARYCLEDTFGDLNEEERGWLRGNVTANGRSWSNPIYNEDGSVNKDESRRVEFKFRLKEAEMIDDRRRIMEASYNPSLGD